MGHPKLVALTEWLYSIKGVLKYENTVKAPISGHPREAEKVSGAGRLLTHSLYKLEFKQGFVKAAESRAVCLRECPFRELQL